MKNFFTCFTIIIGTIIGAGFASGREILSFFCAYGSSGIVGIIISTILFGVIIISVLSINDCTFNNKIMCLFLQFFSFSCFCIMISAVGAFCNQHLKINFWVGSCVSSIIAFYVFLNKFNGIGLMNSILVPLIILRYNNYFMFKL